MADREVKVRLTGDASGAIGAFDKLKEKLTTFENGNKQFIKNFKDHWLGMTATIAGAMVAVNKAMDMVKAGAEYSEQYGILNNLSRKYKTTADEIVSSMKRASDGMIANADLMQVALGGIAKGLKPEQLERLADASKMLSDVAGVTATEALTKMTEALETGRMRGLESLGGTIDLKDAFGDLAGKLTDAEKAQAMYAIIMVRSTEWQNQQMTAIDQTADKLEQLNAEYKNFETTVSIVFKKIAIGFANLPHRMNITFNPYAGYKDLQNRWDQARAEKSSVGQSTSLGMGLPDMAAQKILDDLKESVKTRQEVTKATEKHTKAITSNTKASHDNKSSAKEAEAAHKAAAEAIKMNYDQAINEMMDVINTGVEETKKSLDLIDQYNQMKLDEQMEGLSAADKAIQNVRDAEQAKLNIVKQMYDRRLITDKEYEDKKTKISENAANKVHAIQMDVLHSGLGQMASAFREMSSIYEDGSKSAHMWAEAAKAFEIAQSAAAVASAVAGIANQAGGDPYTAFGRVASMAAVMASFLATIGKSIGGGGGGVTSASTNTYRSTSRTLGSNEASESATKAYDLLKDTYSMQYTKLSAINSELRSLNTNLTGLATSITQTGGANQFLIGKSSNKVDFMMREMFAARGIYMPSTNIKDILSSGGVNASGYMKFGRKPEYSELNPLIDKYVDQSMLDMAKLFYTMGGAFGVGNDVIGQYTIPAMPMNFKGLNDEEIQERIIRQFSDTMDRGIIDIFGPAVSDFVKGFQQIDESIGETVTRLMRDKEIVSEFMTSTGVALKKTTQEAITFSESLINIAGGLDSLTSAFESFYNNFYSDSEKQINYQRQLMDIVDDFGVTTLPKNRDGWRDLVNSMAGVNDEAYVSFLNASDMAHAYYSFIEESSQAAAEAAEQARIDEINSQYDLRASALTEAYNRNLEAAQARLSAITEIVGKLSAARERMKVQDAAIEAMQFRGAKSNLMRGVWSDSSLDTLTGINPGMYSTRRDYLKDYYEIYNQLGALESDALAQQSAAQQTVDWLKRQYDIDLQNLELQRTQAEALVAICNQCTGTKISGYAAGGVAEGWALVGEQGPELVNLGKASRVYNNKDSRSLMDMSELVAEVKAMREDIQRGNSAIANNTGKSARIADKWDYDGIPDTRT